jgi:hypothetical protein
MNKLLDFYEVHYQKDDGVVVYAFVPKSFERELFNKGASELINPNSEFFNKDYSYRLLTDDEVSKLESFKYGAESSLTVVGIKKVPKDENQAQLQQLMGSYEPMMSLKDYGKAVDFATQLFNNYGNMFSCVGVALQIACSARQEIELGNQLLFHEAITHNDSLIFSIDKDGQKDLWPDNVVFPNTNW